MRYTFKVNERLKKEQHINTLFLTGKAFSVFPVRFIYTFITPAEEGASPVQAGFSVPKKKFKSSVHRHRIRRLMVESWRLSKHTVHEAMPAGRQLHLFIIFTDNKMPVYETVRDSIVKAIDKLLPIIAAAGESKD